jgi:hypothetical protein
VYRPVVPVYTQFLDWSISAFQSISQNSEGHVANCCLENSQNPFFLWVKVMCISLVLEMKILIYWSELNSWIYFLYSSLKKKLKNLLVRTKIYWSWAGGSVLIVRTVSHVNAYQNKNDLNHTFNWLNTFHVTFTILWYRLECWYRPVQKLCIDWYYWSIHRYLFVYEGYAHHLYSQEKRILWIL